MHITFDKLKERDYNGFCDDVKEIFSIAVVETFGHPKDGREIISADKVYRTLQNPMCETYAVYADSVKVGGVAIKADATTGHNSLELFYIFPDRQGKGLGLQIWQGVEKMYPGTKVWRLTTPYFEKRNIHFYVNKCGFKIVEFFGKAHCDSNYPLTGKDYHDEYFIFEKLI